MTEIVVIGGGGHAKVLIAVLAKLAWEVLGYTDDRDRGSILGVRRLGGDGVLAEVVARHPRCAAAVGVGKTDTSPLRLDLLRRAHSLGLETPAVVSPHAVVNAETSLGRGTMVFDGAVVNSGAVLGDGCIVNTNATVEHDCMLGGDVHIAPGATISGAARVGEHCMIGAGATVIHGVSISAGTLIGAGAVVIDDVREAGVYVGNPARRIG